MARDGAKIIRPGLQEIFSEWSTKFSPGGPLYAGGGISMTAEADEALLRPAAHITNNEDASFDALTDVSMDISDNTLSEIASGALISRPETEPSASHASSGASNGGSLLIDLTAIDNEDEEQAEILGQPFRMFITSELNNLIRDGNFYRGSLSDVANLGSNSKQPEWFSNVLKSAAKAARKKTPLSRDKFSEVQPLSNVLWHMLKKLLQ